MYNFSNLSISAVIQCGIDIRSLGSNAQSMEETANALVQYFFNRFTDEQGEKSCVLVRFFKTHNMNQLPQRLQDFANKQLQERPASDSFKCLTLLATAGVEDAWQVRDKSQGHQAIPLPSQEVATRIPMIRNLIKQMGMKIETVINPDPDLLLDMSLKTFNVFHVPDAENSPYIPAQDDFVKPYGVKSVLGIGGVLPSGNIFAVIMFSRTPISHEAANLFNTLALNVKLLILPFDDSVFA